MTPTATRDPGDPRALAAAVIKSTFPAERPSVDIDPLSHKSPHTGTRTRTGKNRTLKTEEMPMVVVVVMTIAQKTISSRIMGHELNNTNWKGFSFPSPNN